MINDFFIKLTRLLKEAKRPVFCAFDADGTLWPGDVGRSFFQFLIQKKFLIDKFPEPQKTFNLLLQKNGRKTALSWLAQMLAGVKLTNIQSWVKLFFKEQPLTVFLIQKHLVDLLHSEKVPVYIVSSSIQWVLEEALKKFHIPKKRIIGVCTKIQNGIITDQLIQPPPIKEEKIKALHKITSGKNPFLSAGNTTADLSLLEAASGLQLVISSAKQKDSNYVSERELLQIAKNKGWAYLNKNLKLISI